MSIVQFHYADVKTMPLSRKKQIKSFIQQIFTIEKVPFAKLDFVFCSDNYLLNINQSFLEHDYYTDIITFDLSTNDLKVGEVYISLDRVKENAKLHGVTYPNELLRVMFHGVLHLCGYGDKKKSEITIMRQKEDDYLRLFEKN